MSGKILVTGATGFVGRALCERLLDDHSCVRGTLLPSESSSLLMPGVEGVVVGPLGPDTDWNAALAGVETVIHLAARVHIMNDTSADPLADFRLTNVAGTEKLARDAVQAGVKRLVFVSSIKVNGEEAESPYTESSPAHPVDAYGKSKWEAEQVLRRIESEDALEVVVVRPPLVYGPGVKANFFKLMKIVDAGFPLPLGSIQNRRSLIYVGNLADALVRCATHPAAAGHTYPVGDEDVVSTPELIRRIAAAMGVPCRLFPFPVPCLRLLGAMSGKRSAVDRLLGSLWVDSSAIRTELGWSPPFTMNDGLRDATVWFQRKPV